MIGSDMLSIPTSLHAPNLFLVETCCCPLHAILVNQNLERQTCKSETIAANYYSKQQQVSQVLLQLERSMADSAMH